MNPALLLGLGVGAAAVYLMTRPATHTVTLQTPDGRTVTVQAPNVSSSQVQSAIAQQRETMIQRIMTRDRLSRADAEARYDRMAPAIAAALTAGSPGAPVSGIGNYVRSL